MNSAGPRDVHTVISYGKIVVRNGTLTTRDESRLAKDLTAIVAAVGERQAQGRIWREEIAITEQTPLPWHMYASIRKPDTLDLTLTNNTNDTLSVLVAFSGDVFGGTVAPMLARSTLERFPYRRRNSTGQPTTTSCRAS